MRFQQAFCLIIQYSNEAICLNGRCLFKPTLYRSTPDLRAICVMLVFVLCGVAAWPDEGCDLLQVEGG